MSGNGGPTGFVCGACGYEGDEALADYYEAVNQTVAGTPGDYDYTGTTDTYDDAGTQDECIRCPACMEEIEVFGRFRFVPVEKLAAVDAILAVEA